MTANNDSARSKQRRRFLRASGSAALSLATVPLREEWSSGDYGNDKEVANLEATRASVEKIARLCAQMGR